MLEIPQHIHDRATIDTCISRGQQMLRPGDAELIRSGSQTMSIRMNSRYSIRVRETSKADVPSRPEDNKATANWKEVNTYEQHH